MTMPNVPTNTEDDLPPPELKLVVTDNLDPENSANKGPTVNWIVGRTHPFMSSMKIECMFVGRGANAVYVYSSAVNGTDGARDTIPMRRVRLAHERMALEVLAEEINASLAGEDPYVYVDDDDDDDEPDPAPTAEETPSNGQPSP